MSAVATASLSCEALEVIDGLASSSPTPLRSLPTNAGLGSGVGEPLGRVGEAVQHWRMKQTTPKPKAKGKSPVPSKATPAGVDGAANGGAKGVKRPRPEPVSAAPEPKAAPPRRRAVVHDDDDDSGDEFVS